MTPAVELQMVLPDSKPGLRSSCDAVHPPLELIVQVKLADPDALVVSVAVTVTDEVPAVVGVPEIRPLEELMDSPAGRPGGLGRRGGVEARPEGWGSWGAGGWRGCQRSRSGGRGWLPWRCCRPPG